LGPIRTRRLDQIGTPAHQAREIWRVCARCARGGFPWRVREWARLGGYWRESGGDGREFRHIRF